MSYFAGTRICRKPTKTPRAQQRAVFFYNLKVKTARCCARGVFAGFSPLRFGKSRKTRCTRKACTKKKDVRGMFLGLKITYLDPNSCCICTCDKISCNATLLGAKAPRAVGRGNTRKQTLVHCIDIDSSRKMFTCNHYPLALDKQDAAQAEGGQTQLQRRRARPSLGSAETSNDRTCATRQKFAIDTL
jgi:hypothetical protein